MHQRVSTGSTAAPTCAMSAVNNAVLRESDGICASTPEECIQKYGPYLGKME